MNATGALAGPSPVRISSAAQVAASRKARPKPAAICQPVASMRRQPIAIRMSARARAARRTTTTRPRPEAPSG